MRTRNYGSEDNRRGGEMVFALWAIAIWTSVIVTAIGIQA